MDNRVDGIAIRYIEMWEDTFRATNDKGIVLIGVSQAMSDIELWCNGADRNSANVLALSSEEAQSLYKSLAPAAVFYNFAPNPVLLE